MLTKVPIAGTPVDAGDIFSALIRSIDKSSKEKFILALSVFLKRKYLSLTDSGIAAFYIILKALKANSLRNEVVLPAYTAGNLVVAIRKAGLVPVFCDINLKDFNADNDSLTAKVSSNTLAVLLIHMFGIPVNGIADLKRKLPKEVYIIEDCAQSFGSKVAGENTGSFTDISFFSFNRGKNLPTYGGGCFATDNHDLFPAFLKEYNDIYSKQGARENLNIILKTIAVSLAVNPSMYGIGYPFISKFKDLSPAGDFEIKELTGFQSALGTKLLEKAEVFFRARNKNGLFLINGLKGNHDIILPKIEEGVIPVFNRLPLLFKDPGKVGEAQRRLWKEGIESSRMYIQPLYRMFNLPYRIEDFNNTEYFYPRLLALPVHPGLNGSNLLKMIKAINSL